MIRLGQHTCPVPKSIVYRCVCARARVELRALLLRAGRAATGGAGDAAAQAPSETAHGSAGPGPGGARHPRQERDHRATSGVQTTRRVQRAHQPQELVLHIPGTKLERFA